MRARLFLSAALVFVGNWAEGRQKMPSSPISCGSAHACNDLGKQAHRSKQFEKALGLFARSCELGEGMGCWNAGTVSNQLSRSKTAGAFFKKGCDKENWKSCTSLGLHYRRERQPKNAAAYFQLACKHSEAKACAQLGKVAAAEPQGRARREPKERTRRVPASLSAPPTQKDLFKRVTHGVVIMETSFEGIPVGGGAGFFVSPEGLLVTNYHVLSKVLESGFDLTVTLYDGTIAKGVSVVKCKDERNIDLCLLKTDVRPKFWFDKAKEPLEVGEAIHAIGHPQGLRFSLTSGILSGLRPAGKNGEPGKSPFDLVQVSTPISPGNSGGPMFSSDGDLVGMATAEVISEGSQNLNFAISAREILLYVSNPTVGVEIAEYRKQTSETKQKEANERFEKDMAPNLARMSKGEALGEPFTAMNLPAIDQQTYTIDLPKEFAGNCQINSHNREVICRPPSVPGGLDLKVVNKKNGSWVTFHKKDTKERLLSPFDQLVQASPKIRAQLAAMSAERKRRFIVTAESFGCETAPTPGFAKAKETCTGKLGNPINPAAYSTMLMVADADSSEGLSIIAASGSPEYNEYFKTLATLIASTYRHKVDEASRSTSSVPSPSP